MSKLPEVVATSAVPKPRGTYSQAIIAGQFLFTCGLGPRNADTDDLAPPLIGPQTDQVMSNLQAVLTAADVSLRNVVHVKVYLADLERDFREFDDSYARWWREYRPARTTVGATLYGILVEIEAIAILPLRRRTRGISREHLRTTSNQLSLPKEVGPHGGK